MAEERDAEPRIEAAEDEFTSDSKTCPNCGQPVENLRQSCPNCGHEYTDKERDQDDAGREFLAGARIDDEGNEILDEK